MTTATNTRKPTPAVSLTVRTCVAVAVIAVLAIVWTEAGKSSHLAVQEAQAAMSRTYVTLPRVEVAGKRETPATPVAARAATRRLPQG